MIKKRALLIILLLSLSAIQAQQVEVSFIVSDGTGSDLIVKAGVDPSATDGLDAVMGEAELPPLPPTGIFDARFILPAPPDETVASLNDFRYGNIIPSNEGFVTQQKLTSQLGTGSSDLTLCWDIEGVSLNFKDNITGELFNKDITTSGPGCFTVPLNLTTVIVTITYVKSPISSELNLVPDSLLLKYDANSFVNITVTSNVNWSASSNVSWLSLSPVNGSNNDTVRVTAISKNQVTNERSGTVTITGNGITKTATVTQAGATPVLTVTPDTVFIDSEIGSYADVSIFSNINWTAISNRIWLSITPTTGTNNSTVKITADSSNLFADQRIGSISVRGAGITKLIFVFQSGLIDTIPPSKPTGFSAEVLDIIDGIDLAWDNNVEKDLSHYTIYKGYYNGFEPDSSNILVTTTDTSFVDTDSLEDTNYYKLTATDYTGNESDYAESFIIVSVEEPAHRHIVYSLKQNFPNPFNPSTSISYSVKEVGFVILTVYNSLGQKVYDLVKDYKQTGNYKVTFDANELSSGIYFYKIQANGFVKTKKMILMK